MPSALIHVLTGKNYLADAGVPFFVGTLAPDCIHGREEKDRLHLRLSADRENDLMRLAGDWGTGDPFRLGALLHLYTDYLWDEGPQTAHKNAYIGETWFTDYRKEISLASCHMFHRFDWAPALWEQMLACPRETISSLADYPPEKIMDYIEYNRNWLRDHDTGSSPAFPPEMIDVFCRDAARSFEAFLLKAKL